MIEYSYNPLGNKNADWLVDKMLESGGAITGDSFSGELTEGKPNQRVVCVEFEVLIVEFAILNGNCFVSIYANDGNKQLLMETNKALLSNKEFAMEVLIDFNTIVSDALEAAKKARMQQLAVSNKPIVTSRK